MNATAPESKTSRELQDFYEIDALHTPEERMIRDSVREFVRSELLPHVGEWWREGLFPAHLPKAFGEMGMLGVALPERYGGAGASYTAYGLLNREIEYADSGLRSFVSVQSSLVMWPIHEYGSDAMKETWLPRLASGEAVGCFGLTEPDAGSDPGAMTTRCRKVGDDWIVRGVKRWITSGTRADVAIVWARDEDSGRVLGFLVETDREGFSAEDIKTKASMRASVTSELHLDEVAVPDANRLDVVGLGGALSCLNQARFGIAFGALGAGFATFEEAVRYLEERPSFGVPLTGKQIVQSKLADMLGELTKGSLLAYQLGRLKEAGKDTPARVSLAKRDNVRAALGVARAARDLLGGNGITTEYAAIRHMLNLETVSTYEGTDTIHTLILGREITGRAAF
ncbi:MAG: acyl-CoA dehydrogenase family protein [Trueperaceae bacterium]|nr:acyl-CoA dehydrogenase family protein [Trueperaceae bacterium]